jgi:hypothetical protein
MVQVDAADIGIVGERRRECIGVVAAIHRGQHAAEHGVAGVEVALQAAAEEVGQQLDRRHDLLATPTSV